MARPRRPVRNIAARSWCAEVKRFLRLINADEVLGTHTANGGLLSDIPGEISRDWTGWLGREESNLRMAESKSAALPLGYAPILENDAEACIHAHRADHSGGGLPDQCPLSLNAPEPTLTRTGARLG